MCISGANVGSLSAAGDSDGVCAYTRVDKAAARVTKQIVARRLGIMPIFSMFTVFTPWE